jgi:hypothetical protein
MLLERAFELAGAADPLQRRLTLPSRNALLKLAQIDRQGNAHRKQNKQ